MATKKNSDVVKEFVKKMSDDDLKFVNSRLTQRLGGDIAEAIELIQNDKNIDAWFSTANNGNDFFDMVEVVHSVVQMEVKKRH